MVEYVKDNIEDAICVAKRLTEKGCIVRSMQRLFTMKGYWRWEIYYENSAETESERKEIDYQRLLRMEKRINVYPELREAVRAAMEHEDKKVEVSVAHHNESLKENSQSIHSAKDNPPYQP